MPHRRKLSSEINVVPYIDVMLVLLIIFMVTAPLLTQGIEIDLPDAQAASMTTEQEDRIVYIKASGEVTLSFAPDKEQARSDDEIATMVGAVLRNVPDAMILIQGDKDVRYERVAQIMALLKDSGANKIGFVTEPPAEDKKKK